MKIASRRDVTVFNELNKHRAAWWSQLATAIGAAGAIIPFTAAVLSFQLTFTISVSALFWCSLAVMLHSFGAFLLRSIKVDDDIDVDI